MTQEMETLCLTKGTRGRGRGKEKDVGRGNGQLHNSGTHDLLLLKVILILSDTEHFLVILN